MTLVLSRSPEQEQELAALMSAQQDPASKNYHHWLTPTEMGELFGLSQQDISRVTTWLESQGLHVSWVSSSRTFIGFNGSAADVGKAFQTQVSYYRVNGVQRFSISSPPMIPGSPAPSGQSRARPLYQPGATAPRCSCGAFRFTESHLRLKPLPGARGFRNHLRSPSSLSGAGVAIGIVGRSRTNFADFANFRARTGSTYQNPTEIIPTSYGGLDPGPALTSPPPPGVSDSDQLEATLDVMRAGSVAPRADLLLVVATQASGGIAADAEYLADTNPVPIQVMTISFGSCESGAGPSGVAFWDGLFQQAAAEGISVFVSSGDSGASGCDAAGTAPPANPLFNSPNSICSSSYSTCVGGTEFNDTGSSSQYWSSGNGGGLSSALTYIPEGAWNEPLDSASMLQVDSSGGASAPSSPPQVGRQARRAHCEVGTLHARRCLLSLRT